MAALGPAKPATILVVEDEAQVRILVRRILTRLGYTVLDADGPAGALRLCERFSGEIHLLLSDVIMPRMNGRELAERLLADRPRMKVVFMSGYTDNAIVHLGVLDAGVVFIQKPITPDALARKIRVVLEGRPEKD